jgi:hypothetical protein
MISATRESAYAGDVEQAAHLLGRLPNARRGDEVVNAYGARVPVPAFRAILEHAWEHDHREGGAGSVKLFHWSAGPRALCSLQKT